MAYMADMNWDAVFEKALMPGFVPNVSHNLPSAGPHLGIKHDSCLWLVNSMKVIEVRHQQVYGSLRSKIFGPDFHSVLLAVNP